MAGELIPTDPRAALTALLNKMVASVTDPDVRPQDSLAFAVHEYAGEVREADPADVIQRMIRAAEMLAAGARAFTDAANAAKEELDAELDALGADEITGKVGDKPVFVAMPDGSRYKLTRGHTVTKMFDDQRVVELIATALRADWRPPEGTPGFLTGQLGNAYEAGAADGAALARSAIGSGGVWLSTVLEPLAVRLGSLGDLRGAGMFNTAKREPKVVRKDTAHFEPVRTAGKTRTGPRRIAPSG